MKKLNQKSINKIIFSKLFENTNDTFQDVRIDSSKVDDASMNGVNEPPKPVVPTKLQGKQKTSVKDKPDFFEERKTPEEEWTETFNIDEFYKIWKGLWEQQHGIKHKELMDSEFQQMLEYLRREYLRLRRERNLGNGNYGQTPIKKAFQEIIKKFYRYFTHPPTIV
jgi:hypothetical protein